MKRLWAAAEQDEIKRIQKRQHQRELHAARRTEQGAQSNGQGHR